MDPTTRFRTYQRMLEDLGAPLRPDSVLVDLGCGAGETVAAGRKRGFQTFGADIGFKKGPHTDELAAARIIRTISLEPYRLPFDDNSVDCIVSDQVFEHVSDYESCLAEMHRILKPGGSTLHIFPSRYSPLEPHVHVPFATVFRPKPWLQFWAALGVRKANQRGRPASEVAEENHRYLTSSTNYLSKREIRREFQRFFPNVRFVEDSFLKQSGRARILHQLKPVLPFLPALYSFARCRVVFGNRGPLRSPSPAARFTAPAAGQRASGA